MNYQNMPAILLLKMAIRINQKSHKHKRILIFRLLGKNNPSRCLMKRRGYMFSVDECFNGGGIILSVLKILAIDTFYKDNQKKYHHKALFYPFRDA